MPLIIAMPFWILTVMACYGVLGVAVTRGAQLSGGMVNPTNQSEFVFRLGCQSNEHYLIQWSPDLANWTTFQHSSSSQTNRLLQVSMSLAPQGFWRAALTNEPLFGYALVARHSLDFGTSYVEFDSFDSGNPFYSTHGRWDPAKRRDNGSIALLTNGLSLSNAFINGRVHLDSNATVSIGANSVIGSLAYTANPANRGTIQPGAVRHDAGAIFLPEVELPTHSDGWAPFPVRSPTPVVFDGAPYDYVLFGGDYLVTGSSWSNSTLIAGNVRVRVDSVIQFTGLSRLTVLTNSSLRLYINCATAVFGGNGLINYGRAADVICFGTSLHTALVLNGNADIVAAFYVPSADVLFGTGGISLGDLSGAIVAKSLHLQTPLRFHFDEDLLLRGPLK